MVFLPPYSREALTTSGTSMGRVNIPWIGVEYNMDKGFNILYIF
jgi:hypothetical protein